MKLGTDARDLEREARRMQMCLFGFMEIVARLEFFEDTFSHPEEEKCILPPTLKNDDSMAGFEQECTFRSETREIRFRGEATFRRVRGQWTLDYARFFAWGPDMQRREVFIA